MTEKRSGQLKGRTCADGEKQRKYISKEESSSPTVSTENFLTALVIDAREGIDTATCDILGAYLNADMDEFTTMKLEAEIVDMMVKVYE